MKGSARYILIVAGLIILGVVFWYFISIVAYILIAAVLSLIGHPVVDFLSKLKVRKITLPRALCATLTLILFWAVIITFFWIFIPLIAGEAKQISSIKSETLMEHLEEPLHKAEDLFGKIQISGDENVSFQEFATGKIVSFLSVSDLSKIFSSIAGVLGNIFIAFFAISFISFFFLKDEKMFFNFIIILVPSRHEEAVKKVLGSIKNLLRRYFIGIAIDVCVVFTLITTGLSIIGLELHHALIIGLFMGMLNVIPYVGPIIGGALGLIIGIATHLHMDFYSELMPLLGLMLIVFIAVQILDATLLQPTIYSSSVKAHPLEIFLVILVAGSLAGIAGMVLAIPSYTIIRVIAKEFFNQFKVVKKLTDHI